MSPYKVAAFSVAVAVVMVRPMPAPSQDTITIETRLVLIDVIVRDDDGPVPGLGVDDFALFDNGRPRRIAVFDEIRDDDPAARELPAGIVSNRLDSQGREPAAATVILIDRINTDLDGQTYVLQEFNEFLESWPGRGRLAVYELRRELSVLHDYDSPLERLVARAAELAPEDALELRSADGIGGFESSEGNAGLDRQLAEFLGGRNENLAGRGFAGGVDRIGLSETARGGFEQFSRAQRGNAAAQLNARAVSTATALETIAYQLAGLRGRKNLVWLSGRFPFTFNPYRRTDLAEEVVPTTLALIERAGLALMAANIAVYPVNAGGGAASANSDRGAMQDVADRTGGRIAYDTNDIAGAIDDAVEDARVSYRLGFYPDGDGGDDGFHEIRIDVFHPDARVRHRAGYYGFDLDVSERLARSVPTVDLLRSPLDATAVGLTARAVPGADPGAFNLALLVALDDLNLVSTDGLWLGAIDVAMYFDPGEGREVSVLPIEQFPIRLNDEQLELARQTGFIVQKNLHTGSETGRLRIVVQDMTTGSAGSIWVPVGN